MGGLLQRVPASLVVFATDGAAPGFGCERMFGSLKAYSDVCFQEASRALAHVPNASFQRMTKPDGSYFVELHLFEELREASASLCALGRSFSPDAIISHAYEGAHIDHDTCSFLAMHAADDLSLMCFEVPLYWLDGQGNVVRLQFRDRQSRIVAPNMKAPSRTSWSCNLAKQKSSARRECWPSIKRNATLSQLSRLLSNAYVRRYDQSVFLQSRVPRLHVSGKASALVSHKASSPLGERPATEVCGI